MGKYLSIDAGGTFIKYAWMSKDGELIRQGKEKTPLTNKEDFLEQIKKIWEVEKGEKIGICMSLPGTIDSSIGYIFQGGSLTYHNNLNIKEWYEQEFKVKVEIENDARCAAIAELAVGNMKGIKDGVVLTFGTGVGGCLIIDHKIHIGQHLFSGEVSILISENYKNEGYQNFFGQKCGVGHLIKKICLSKNVELVNGERVFEWILNNDEIAIKHFQRFCDDIAVQLFNLQIILDPSRICLGGGVSENPVFIQGVKNSLDMLYDSMPVSIPRLDVVACKFNNEANLIGAFYNFKNQNIKSKDQLNYI
ncbi:MAG: ROK family protein [Erysipelotrichaceae bacterium]